MSGALIGLIGALGFILIFDHIWRRKVRLDQRLAPYLVQADLYERTLGQQRISTPLGVFWKLIQPWTERLEGLLSIFSSPRTELERRLERAGRKISITQYRVEQLQWGTVGLIVSLLTVLTLANSRNLPLPIALLIITLGPFIGLALCDWALNRAITKRTERILSEFPTVAELLALSVSAGEGPMSALQRVANQTNGALAEELNKVLAHVRSGETLPSALEALGDRTQTPAITRFATGVSIAVERGTPLAHVLRAQAQDARDLGHRELMELGGKKEIHMLFPVIFLLLPITVAFAIFPSAFTFDLGL
ncbi:type II secretion system F family protein [Timonella sp. A28]|uniref:type II secretion system F family protein n=1 Tax=Timonella sp. A28 TaxID=3442640 RepID=UPI003EBD0796